MLNPLYGDVFEFLSSLIEFMQLDPPPTRGIDIVEYLVNAYERLQRGEAVDRNALLFLYRTRMLIPCSRGVAKLKVFRDVGPVEVCIRSGGGVPTDRESIRDSIIDAILNWHPIKILVRYLAWRGGSASIDDVVRDLGCFMKRLTGELFDALKLVIPEERTLKTPRMFLDRVRELCGPDIDEKGVLKPFNKRRVQELLVPILSSLRLAELDGDSIVLTELGLEYSRNVMLVPTSELVVTEPLFPQTYMALLSVLYRAGHEVFIVSPWVEISPEGEGLLLSLLRAVKGRYREIKMVLRDDEHNRRVLKLALAKGAFKDLPISIYLVKNLHAKMYLSLPALITSANLLFTSVGLNYEVGIYYPVAPRDLMEFRNLLLSAAIEFKLSS